MLSALKIVMLCVGAAVAYGILHDQVTARVCVEYFTIGHPRVVATEDPTVLGCVWGVLATWWVGLLLGISLAVAARAGGRPKRSAGSLVRPVGNLLAVMAAGALLSGVTGWLLARAGAVYLVPPLASEVPADRHVPFLADLWAHSASYALGFLGVVTLAVLVWRSRGYPPTGLARPNGESSNLASRSAGSR